MLKRFQKSGCGMAYELAIAKLKYTRNPNTNLK